MNLISAKAAKTISRNYELSNIALKHDLVLIENKIKAAAEKGLYYVDITTLEVNYEDNEKLINSLKEAGYKITFFKETSDDISWQPATMRIDWS